MVRSARFRTWLLPLVLSLPFGLLSPQAKGDELPEYRLKAAFIYNFVLFTEWPSSTGGTLNLCVFGADPFGKELDQLNGKSVGLRSLTIQRKATVESLGDCQVVFVTRAAIGELTHVLQRLRGLPTLTIADSPGAARKGVALNMLVEQSRVAFEANLAAARSSGLTLSSKLLSLAIEVIQ